MRIASLVAACVLAAGPAAAASYPERPVTIVSAFQYLARFVAVLSHRGERRLARRRATGAAGPTGASGTSDATGATAPRRDDPATTR